MKSVFVQSIAMPKHTICSRHEDKEHPFSLACHMLRSVFQVQVTGTTLMK